MKNILVTGASSGIGLGIVTTLGKNGHKVFAGVLNQSEKDLFPNLKNVIPVILDVEDDDNVESVKTLLEKEGLDILINNAGIGIAGPLIEVSKKEMQKQFNVNVFSQIIMIQAMRDLLINSKGHIISISSINGHVPSPYSGLYAMSKFAIEAMNEALRVELNKFGIRVTTVNPGLYHTQMLYKLKEYLAEKADKSIYYKEMYAEMKNFDPTGLGRDVSIIGNDLLKIVNSETPPDRFVSANGEEKKELYNTIINRLRDLMSNSDLTLEEFIQKHPL